MENTNKNTNNTVDFLNKENKKNFLKKKFTRQEYLEFKLKICKKYCQVHPFIMINLPEAVRCQVCNEATYDSAVISFLDRKSDGTEKQFTIDRVCPDCLDKIGIVHVTRTQIARYLVLQRGHVLLKSNVSEQHKFCYLCQSNQEVPTALVRLKIKGLFLDVPVCEKHANKCLVDKKVLSKLQDDSESISLIEQFSNELDVVMDVKAEVAKFNEGYSMATPKTITEEVDEEFSDIKSYMKEE